MVFEYYTDVYCREDRLSDLRERQATHLAQETSAER